jgi:hypothetical protein
VFTKSRNWYLFPPYPLYLLYFNIILPFMPRSPDLSHFFRVSNQNPVRISLLLHIGYISHVSTISSSSMWSRDNVCCGVRIMKLLIIQFFPASYYCHRLKTDCTGRVLPGNACQSKSWDRRSRKHYINRSHQGTLRFDKEQIHVS